MCGRHHREHMGSHCFPPVGRVRGFAQPWLLLLLSRKPTHGYELMEQLGQDEDTPDVDPGLLYRTLRQLEEDGLVRSSWDTAGAGPARRVYEITDEGIEYLHAWTINIRRTRTRLDRFLAEYETRFPNEEGR